MISTFFKCFLYIQLWKAFSGFFSSSNPCEPGPKFNSADCSAVIGMYKQVSNSTLYS